MLRLALRRLPVALGGLLLACGVVSAGSAGLCTNYAHVAGLLANVGAGDYCTIGDLYFANFTEPSTADPNGSTLTGIPVTFEAIFTEISPTEYALTIAGIGGPDGLSGGTGGASDYILSFTIGVDPGAAGYGISEGMLLGSVGGGDPPTLFEIFPGLSSTHTYPGSGSPTVFPLPDTTPLEVGTGIAVPANQSTSGLIDITDAFLVETPEPASCALLGIGLLAFGWMGRRRARGKSPA